MSTLNNKLIIGNAKSEGLHNSGRGWFIGNFIDPANGLKCTNHVEVKWGVHSSNEEKPVPAANEKATTLTLLISGSFVVDFPDFNKSINLNEPSDYIIFAPGVIHSWKALEDSVVLTVRWPSIIGDQKQVS